MPDPDAPVTGAATPATSAGWQHRLPFFYGYLIVAIAFVLAFANAGQLWAFSVLAVPMENDLGWSRSFLFGMLTLRGITAGAIAPFLGRMADSDRGVRALVTASGVVGALSAYLCGQVTDQWTFALLFGLLGGVSMAGQGFIMGAVVVPKWFIRRRSTMVAFTSMGGACSLLVLPPLVSAMEAATGWRSVWTMLAVLSVVIGLLPPLLIRRQPEDLGMHPDGDTTVSVQARRDAGQQEVAVTLRTALRNRNLWLLMVGTALGTIPMTSLTVTLVPIFLDRGIAPDLAALGLSGFGLASFGSRFVWGPLGDRFHIRRVLMVIALVSAAGTVSIFGLTGLWVLSYGALTGFGIGGYVGLFQAVWGAYYGRAHLGAIAGVTQPLVTLCNASGSFLLAYIRDATGSYDAGLWLYSGVWLTCGLLLFAAKPAGHQPPGVAGAGLSATPR